MSYFLTKSERVGDSQILNIQQNNFDEQNLQSEGSVTKRCVFRSVLDVENLTIQEGNDELIDKHGSKLVTTQQFYEDNFTLAEEDKIPFSIESPRVRKNSILSKNTTSQSFDISVPINEFSNAIEKDSTYLDPFLLNEMPRGRFITMNIFSTWGDIHEVGLNGIEIFNEYGERIIPPLNIIENYKNNFKEYELKKSKEKIRITNGFISKSYTLVNNNILIIIGYPNKYNEEFNFTEDEDDNDEDKDNIHSIENKRYKIKNLINGFNNTHDESKLFIMPFTPKGHHLICFVFPQNIKISMIRIYNYSGRGRVYTHKGVRGMEITVDDKVVFRGDIIQNNGNVISSKRIGLENCENILFTEDIYIIERLLSISNEKLSVSNESLKKLQKSNVEGLTFGSLSESTTTTTTKRKRTTTTVLFNVDSENKAHQIGSEKCVIVPAFVSDNNNNNNNNHKHSSLFNTNLPVVTTSSSPPPRCISTDVVINGGERCVYSLHSQDKHNVECPTNITSLCLFLLGTWGDMQNIGLSGLRLRDVYGDIVSQHITHWYVRFPSQEENDGDVNNWTDQLIYLFDENAETALTLPCERGVEIIFIFATPLPTLRFLEVANYSLGEHTFSGVKEARLFLSSATSFFSPDALVKAYAALWISDLISARNTLAAHNIFEVTPEEGVILRKAPAFLSIPRFQVYDLSLGSKLRSTTTISGGGGGGGAVRLSLSHSLSASMTIRAEMALRRARMALKPRPEWLLEYQPYITPLLPVAYVLKLSLVICARSVIKLKQYAKEWMLEPLCALTLINENGERIYTRSCSPHNNNNNKWEKSNDDLSEKVTHDFVTECLFTPLPSGIQEDIEAAAVAAHIGIQTSLLQASVSLVYVADSPFCISILTLNRPLVEKEGCEAWVRQIRVLMDDALVFDSGDVGPPRLSSQFTSTVSGISEDQITNTNVVGATYRTRGKSVVFFTLDAGLLEKTRREMMEKTV